jgi:hypothetical protein
MDFEARSMRAQRKRADRVSARVCLIVGGDELSRGEVTVRDMRTGEQRPVPRDAVVTYARDVLAGGNVASGEVVAGTPETGRESAGAAEPRNLE